MNINILKILLFCLCIFCQGCSTNPSNLEEFKKYTAKQILKQGKKEFNNHNYKESLKYFEAVYTLYPFDPSAEKAQLMSIYAYYKSDDNLSALAAANYYIHLYPIGEYTDRVYYLKGIVNLEKDRNWIQKTYTKHENKLDPANLREAFVDFETLIKVFPNSKYVKDAKFKMNHIRELLARRELYIADFYFSHKAYVAAINRASEVVKEFSYSQIVTEDAFKIMIKSYRALGMYKQANNTLYLLKSKFPKKDI